MPFGVAVINQFKTQNISLMKKILLIILLISTGSFLQSCLEGPTGPPGPRGSDGLDGLDGEEAYVFEYELDFVGPDYSALLELPSNFEPLPSDMILVYFLWGNDNGEDIWRLLPQTLITDSGLLQYNFDFTRYNVVTFLDAEFPLSQLGADYTDNWIARVVVVPGQFGGRVDVDFSDYNDVVDFYGISSEQTKAENYISRPE